MNQQQLFADVTQAVKDYPFDGVTFNRKLDGSRLTTLFERVFELMRDGRWRTLGEIQAQVGGSETGIAARIRDFRKAKFGGHIVQHRRRTAGLWEYRLVVNDLEMAA